MPIQLTPEQEKRIHAIVDAGAYHSTREALDAAVAAVEIAAVPGFEGTQQDLDELLLEGLNSGNPVPVDETFWQNLQVQTEHMLADFKASKNKQ